MRLMRKAGLLATSFPEVDALYGVPQNPEHHPEVDTGIHTEMALQMAELLGASTRAKFAVLTHDLGKALTPVNELPKHVDHEIRGLDPVATLCDRHQVPLDWKNLALLVCEFHLHAHRAFEMRSTSVVKFLQNSGLDKEDTRFFEDFVVACEADKRGRLGKEEKPYHQGAFLREAYRALVAHPYSDGETMYTPGGIKTYEARLTGVRKARDPYRELRAPKQGPVAC